MPMFYDGDFVTTYRVMEEFVASGQARAIGVSNFEIHHLDKLLAGTSIRPLVNQVELHPYFTNAELAAYCAERDRALGAWSRRARGVLGDAVIAGIAEAAGVSHRRRWCWHGTSLRGTLRSRSPHTCRSPTGELRCNRGEPDGVANRGARRTGQGRAGPHGQAPGRLRPDVSIRF